MICNNYDNYASIWGPNTVLIGSSPRFWSSLTMNTSTKVITATQDFFVKAVEGFWRKENKFERKVEPVLPSTVEVVTIMVEMEETNKGTCGLLWNGKSAILFKYLQSQPVRIIHLRGVVTFQKGHNFRLVDTITFECLIKRSRGIVFSTCFGCDIRTLPHVVEFTRKTAIRESLLNNVKLVQPEANIAGFKYMNQNELELLMVSRSWSAKFSEFAEQREFSSCY